MVQITKITVSFGYTLNRGNFESLRADCSLEATIDPMTDDVYEELKKLQADAREQVRQELARVDARFEEPNEQ